MIESLLGSVLGGLFRLAPEVMKQFDRKNERAHEIAMFDKQLAADAQRAKLALDQTEAAGNIALSLEDIKAMVEGVKVQGQLTGIKAVDAINALMRPVITFWWVIILQTAVMIATFFAAFAGNGGDAIAALLSCWTPAERGIVASIISFWFVDRAIVRGQGR